jgi:lysophospholipase L1-like esterase
MFCGDSNVVGQGAGSGVNATIDARKYAWPVVMGKAMGWNTNTWFGNHFLNVAGSTTLDVYDPRITLGSYLSSGGLNTFAGFAMTCVGASVTDFAFTPEDPFDTLVFWHIGGAGRGTVSIKIDGDVVDTFSEVTATAIPTKRTYSVSLGSHVVSVQCVSGTTNIMGMETSVASQGKPVLIEGGICGGKWNDLRQVGSAFSYLNAIPHLSPDVVVTHCTINDIIGGTTIGNLLTYMSEFNHAVPVYADLFHTVSWPFAGSETLIMLQLLSFLQSSAIAAGGSYASAYPLFGTYYETVANDLNFDTLHLNASGWQLIAEMFADLFA